MLLTLIQEPIAAAASVHDTGVFFCFFSFLVIQPYFTASSLVVKSRLLLILLLVIQDDDDGQRS